MHESTQAQPLQAALASALAFGTGAVLPLLTAGLAPHAQTQIWLAITTLPFLGLLGMVAAYTGGANIAKSVTRVVLWGTVALLATAAIGRWFGVNP